MRQALSTVWRSTKENIERNDFLIVNERVHKILHNRPKTVGNRGNMPAFYKYTQKKKYKKYSAQQKTSTMSIWSS